MKILLVEDDQSIADLLNQALSRQHYLVDLAADGQTGSQLADSFEYDLILLDLMLPKLDGISLCRQRRQDGDRTPILLVTAEDTQANKIEALDAGADDYVVKPFDIEELLARVRALLRRGKDSVNPVLEWGQLFLKPDQCQVTYQGKLLKLTAKEYELVELFLRNPRRIFSQSALLDHLWSFDEPPSETAVRTQIKGLRQKLKRAGAKPDFIETIYGLGYRLKAQEPSTKPQVKKSHHSTSTIPQQLPFSPLTPTHTHLQEIWRKHRNQYLHRVQVVEQAIQALRYHNLREDLQQKAIQEAHTLNGSLGSFGFLAASQICRQIEQLLQETANLSETEVINLSKLVGDLYQQLRQDNSHSRETQWLETLTTPSKLIHSTTRLLIVDPDLALAQALETEATAWGITAQIASNLEQARQIIQDHSPEVVLLDLCFPGAKEREGGWELLTELTNQQPPVCVIVFTAHESFSQRVKVARLGAKGFLHKPISPVQVMEVVNQILQPTNPTVAKIMIVDDDPQILDLLRTLLEKWGFQVTLLDNPEHFWQFLPYHQPDLVILDLEMPNLSGIDICQVVRNDPQWQNLPILFLSAHQDATIVQQVFSAGADDYISKPIVGPELIARVQSRLDQEHYRRQLAGKDFLTGLTNRHQSIPQLTNLLNLAKRQNQSWCLIVLRLDFSSVIRNQYDPEIVDQITQNLGGWLKKTFRSEDIVARWGELEFVLGLYDIHCQAGVTRLTQLLNLFSEQEFTDVKGQKLPFTFSAGVAQYPQHGQNLKLLYQAADQFAVEAKVRGGNQVFPL